jgi:DNA polymerase III subunit epsilon
LCRRYSIDNSKREKHGALLDSELLADVYLRLIGAEQAGLNLMTQHASSAQEQGEAAVQVRLKPLPPRITAEEAEAHAAFVASLGPKAIWARYAGAEPEQSAA